MARPTTAAVLLTCFAALPALADGPPAATRPTAVATTGPATRPEPTERDRLLAEEAALPRADPITVTDFFTVSIEDGLLMIRPKRPAPGTVVAIRFTDWPGFVTANPLAAPDGVSLTHTTLSENDTRTTLTQVLSLPGYLSLSRGDEWSTGRTHVVELSQRATNVLGDSPVTLRINDDTDAGEAAGRPPQKKSLVLVATSFADLVRDHPDETREHLGPILHDLGAPGLLSLSDAPRAWQVLGPYTTPDVKLNERIDLILRQLDGDDFAARTKAEQALTDLGPAGAAELRRRKTAILPPDVRTAVETAVRNAEPLTGDRAAALASDVPFLLETLRLDEPRLRTAAARRLTTVTGKPLDLPADLPAAERKSRIDAYVALVGPATRPTTRPAAKSDVPTEMP